MYNNKSSKLSAIIGLLLSVFTLHAQSECGSFEGFVDNKDGTVTDPRFGTVWKRCAEGAVFDDKSRIALLACNTTDKTMDWIEAMQAAKNSRFLGKDDWRIPTLVELYSITGHSPGFFKDCTLKNAYYGEYNGYAVSDMLQVRTYWSTTHAKNQTDIFHILSFASGEMGANSYNNSNSVILVRAGTPSPTSDGKLEKQFEFDHEYANYVSPILNQQAKRQQARSKEFQDVLNGNDPQAMYLAAGKYRRARQDVDAAVIYETIISRFPSSPWAVKANDQLESSKPVDVYVH